MALLSCALLLGITRTASATPVRAPRAGVAEFKLPNHAEPSGEFAAGPGGSLWFTESNSTNGEIVGEITSHGTIRQIRNTDNGASAQGIAVQPNGNIWCDRLADSNPSERLERLAPSGAATFFEYPSVFASGATRLVIGAGSTIWFTSDGALGRLAPSGVMTKFGLPHRLTPNGIIVAPDGDIWFTATVGIIPVAVHDYIGRIAPSGALKLFRIPTTGTEPKGIAWGPDGNIWVAERGAFERLTPRGHFTRFRLKFRGSQPQGVAVGKHGIWFTDAGTGKIGFITLSGKATEYASPTPRYGSLSAIALAPNGVVWFQEIGDVGGAIGRLTHRG